MYQTEEDTKAAAAASKIKNVDRFNRTMAQSSYQSTATGEINSLQVPAEATAWGDAYTAKRQS